MSEKVIAEVKCNCVGHCQTIELKKYDYNNGEVDYAIDFRVSIFSSGNILSIIQRRLKLAWLAIRKGNYIHNDICIDRYGLYKLHKDLTEYLDNYKRGDYVEEN